MAELLTDEDYKIILKRKFKEETIIFISSNAVPLSENTEGFMGNYFILKIKYSINSETREEKFFLKTFPMNLEVMMEIASQRNVYEKEIFFYDFLMREYESLRIDTSFAPKCFYCKDKKLLVMENLPDRGYKLSQKLKFYDLQHCKIGLQALAKYNAASLIYEEKMSEKCEEKFRLGEKYGEVFTENYLPSENNQFGVQLYNSSIKNMEKMIKKCIFDETNSEFVYDLSKTPKSEEKINDFVQKLNDTNIFDCLLKPSGYRKCCGHGDFWYNNIFFSYQNSNVNKCCFVDYQTLRYAPPAFDVILFIYLNTTSELRAKNLTNLLFYYYVNLKEMLSKHGYDIANVLSKQEFDKSVRELKRAALFNTWMINAAVLLPEDQLNELCQDPDKDDWTKSSSMHINKAFNQNTEYRQVLIGNLNDLYKSFLDK